jgi:hypothetical protein
MATYAKGVFEAKPTPHPADQHAEAAPLGRLSIDKQFRGDLQATSRGEMRAAGTSVKGSGGFGVYIAGSVCVFLAKALTVRITRKTMPEYHALPGGDQAGEK